MRLRIGLRAQGCTDGGRGSKLPRHCHPQFAMVVPHLRTALAFGGAVFRGCALRFASCARHSSPSGLRCAALPPLSSAWSLRIVRKLTRGAPCFTGLIDGYCSHWLRRLFRPHWGLRIGLRFAGPVFRGCGRPLGVSSPLHPFGASTATACFAHCARPSCAPLAAPPLSPSLGLLRPVSRAARGLRALRPVSAKILRISGRGNCKEALFALENGIFRRKKAPRTRRTRRRVRLKRERASALSRSLLGF